MKLLLLLILSHLLTEFVLQPQRWYKQKRKKKFRSAYFYIHLLLYFLITILLVGQYDFWPYVAILTLAHGLVDSFPWWLNLPMKKHQWFFIDQLLHLIFIVAIWYAALLPPFQGTLNFQTLAVLTGLVALTLPSSTFIRFALARWEPESTKKQNRKDRASLQSAGKIIGILERLFVYVFILLNQWQVIGFLIAAKSVFRFGDLRDAPSRKLTEYVLIGTLLSFGLAIGIGLVVDYLMDYGDTF